MPRTFTLPSGNLRRHSSPSGAPFYVARIWLSEDEVQLLRELRALQAELHPEHPIQDDTIELSCAAMRSIRESLDRARQSTTYRKLRREQHDEAFAVMGWESDGGRAA